MEKCTSNLDEDGGVTHFFFFFLLFLPLFCPLFRLQQKWRTSYGRHREKKEERKTVTWGSLLLFTGEVISNTKRDKTETLL